jgi:hypothetical protein
MNHNDRGRDWRETVNGVHGTTEHFWLDTRCRVRRGLDSQAFARSYRHRNSEIKNAATLPGRRKERWPPLLKRAAVTASRARRVPIASVCMLTQESGALQRLQCEFAHTGIEAPEASSLCHGEVESRCLDVFGTYAQGQRRRNPSGAFHDSNRLGVAQCKACAQPVAVAFGR